ncbi:hypothetical protein IHE45_04G035600 [Dioscorea alata]|uniref:Uncharacterized protein n=1 Tax=Dioscorea alata TaxID=55571 RepID=A0ACB7WBP0_DIOAL|nr:hypothetical protein IHE45_04G035600 [Dioscorea alata]
MQPLKVDRRFMHPGLFREIIEFIALHHLRLHQGYLHIPKLLFYILKSLLLLLSMVVRETVNFSIQLWYSLMTSNGTMC